MEVEKNNNREGGRTSLAPGRIVAEGKRGQLGKDDYRRGPPP